VSLRLQLFRSLWTNGFDLDAALADCRSGEFDGVEGPVPEDASLRRTFAEKLRHSGVPFIAEITTGGGYVPTVSDPARHLAEFRRKAATALDCAPQFVTVLAGCDAWPVACCIDFYGDAIAAAHELGVTASFETHRSRPTFHPWATDALLAQLPALELTCDFSHWCCVCERLVLDGEPDLLARCAARARHIHARVGYEQGPQVPHPAAPEYYAALTAHERWWRVLWAAQEETGREFSTMTPEFGPDGYLQAQPFTAQPAADLDEINRWMVDRQREHFAARANPRANPQHAALS